MSAESDNSVVRFGNLLACGLLLLAIVLYTPNAGFPRGDSFLQIARTSLWSQWFDWVAAWCSLKIILLNLAALLLLLAIGALLDLLNLDRGSERFFLVVLLPIFGSCVGAYYLLRALL